MLVVHHAATAYPRWVRSGEALDASRILVELLADDDARRTTGASAGGARRIPGASCRMPAAESATVLRIQRLSEPPLRCRLLSATTYADAAALLVVPTVTVAMPVLQALATAV